MMLVIFVCNVSSFIVMMRGCLIFVCFLQVDYCYVFGLISAVLTMKGWYYNSCSVCNRKVVHNGSYFTCFECGVIVDSVLPKFKLDVKVSDDSGSVILELSDREVTKMLRCSALDLLHQFCTVRILDVLVFHYVFFFLNILRLWFILILCH